MIAVERESTSAAEVEAIRVWRCGTEVSGLSPSVHGESSVGITAWWPESLGRRTRVSCSSSSSSSSSECIASSFGGDGVEDLLGCRSCSAEDDGLDTDVDVAAEVAITVEGAKDRAEAE